MLRQRSHNITDVIPKKNVKTYAFYFLLVFVMCRVSILKDVAPFGLSVIAAAWTCVNPAVLLFGGLMGALSYYPSIHYDLILGALIFCLAYPILEKKMKKKLLEDIGMISLIAAYVVPLLLLKTGTLQSMLTGVMGSTLGVLYYATFKKMIGLKRSLKKRTILTEEELVALTLTMCLFISALGLLNIHTINVGNVVSSYLVMLFGLLLGAGPAACLAVAFGLAMGTKATISLALVGSLAVCALLGGVFRSLKKPGVMFGFLIGNVLLTLYADSFVGSGLLVIEGIIAAVLFALTPWSAVARLKKFTVTKQSMKQVHAQRLKEETTGRLFEFAHMLGSLSRTLSPSKERGVSSEEQMSDICNEVRKAACKGCPRARQCWETEVLDTYTNMVTLLSIYSLERCVQAKDMPSSMLKKCDRSDKLITALNNVFEDVILDKKLQQKLYNCRMLVKTQIEGVSNVIDLMAKQIETRPLFSGEIEDEIMLKLDGQGVRVKEVMVERTYKDKLRIQMQVKSCGGNGVCENKIKNTVSKCVGKKMNLNKDLCLVEGKKNRYCTLTFTEASIFEPIIGVAKTNKAGSSISGDSLSILPLDDTTYLFIMSDGMGSGIEAHKESKTTVDLVSLFFRTGFNRETVFETINDILLLRGEDEIFSTLDVCVLDLTAGVIELTKIGSSPSYIVKDDQMEKITSTNLPIGILDNITPAAFRRTLNADDCLIMMTDGVYDNLNDKMTARELSQYMTFLQHSSKDASSMANHILKTAIGNDEPSDDMSVLCMYLKEAMPITKSTTIKNRMTNVLHIDRAKRKNINTDNVGLSE